MTARTKEMNPSTISPTRAAPPSALERPGIPSEQGSAFCLDIAELRPSQRLMRVNMVLTVLGGLILIAGLVWARQRIWLNLLLTGYYLAGLALGALFFIALQFVLGARWGIALRRAPEAMASLLPVAAIVLAVVLLARPSIYPWISDHGGHGEGGWSGFKRLWLDYPFFLLRSATYLFLWIFFARAIAATSRRQDKDGDRRHTQRNIRLSAGFLVIFALTVWLAAHDWIMSLEPEWYSAIFGVYHFAGLFLGGLAGITLLVVWLRQKGPLRSIVSEDHLHDLGKLLFAISTFWAYIWFSQYMLIWYANIPEETSYFIRRVHGTWGPLFLLNLMLNWVVPFLALLSKRAKRRANMLVRISIIVLVGRWLDLYLMIFPSQVGARPVFGIWELGIMLGAIGLSLLVIVRALRKAFIVPIRDPYLWESLHHHQ